MNDTIGHPVATSFEERRAAAERTVRRPDLVGRLGGDEFAILQNTPSGRPTPRRSPNASCALLAGRIRSTGCTLKSTPASASLAFPPTATRPRSPEERRHRALQCQGARRPLRRFFEPGEDEPFRGAPPIEADLALALARKELFLHYQPIVNVKTNAVTSFEALMRWHHPRLGLIRPPDFIPIAEQTGLIVAMGEWALRQPARTPRSGPTRSE